MESKIKFDAESVEVVQIDAPQYFTKLKVKIVKPGNNAHNLPISQEAIENSKSSLIGKPILCHLINRTGDFGSHDEDEQAVGITALGDDGIFFDGEYLCTYSFLWKRYFENVVDVFRNTPENKVSVSMEIDVTSYELREDGLTWITGFCFAGVTLLGKKIQPAISGADATVVEFSKLAEDFEHDKQILFSSQKILTHFPKHGQNKPVALVHSQYPEFDYDYAVTIKSEYPSVWGRGGNLRGDETFALWGKTRSGDISSSVQDWIREREQWSKRHNRDRSLPGVIAQIKWGMVSDYGIESMKTTLEKSKEEHDAKNRAYFEISGGESTMPYKSMDEVNPSIKGIEPPVTLAQANAIARQADSVGTDEEKNGWAIAISSFKKSHEVKDGKWVEKDKKDFEKEVEQKMADNEKKEEIKEEKIESVEMAEPPKEEAKKEAEEKEVPAEDKAETPKEEAKEEKEEEKPAEKKFALADFCDLGKMSEFMKGEEFEAEFAAEVGKEEGVDFSVIVKACYAKMCKMAAENAKLKEDNEAYMSRFAEIEKQKFSIEVESQLQEVSDVLSKDEIEECRTDAVNFSMETVDGWKNKVKALAFTHTKGKKVDSVIKYALPFRDMSEEKSNLLFK